MGKGYIRNEYYFKFFKLLKTISKFALKLYNVLKMLQINFFSFSFLRLLNYHRR